MEEGAVGFALSYFDTGGIYNPPMSGDTPWAGTVHGCGDGTLAVSFTGGDGCATITPRHAPDQAVTECGGKVHLDTYLPCY